MLPALWSDTWTYPLQLLYQDGTCREGLASTALKVVVLVLQSRHEQLHIFGVVLQ